MTTEAKTFDPGLKTKMPIHLLFVNYHGTMGGGQVQMLTILDGLDREKFLPHVVCCQEGEFVNQLRQRGIEPDIIPFGKGKLRYLPTSLQAIWQFYKLLKARHIQLVQVIGLQEAKLATWACSVAKVPLIWVVQP